MVKRCRLCSEERELSEFYANPRLPGGLCHECKVCWRARARTYRKANPTAATIRNRRYKAEKRYGITYSVALELRSRMCAICGAPPPEEGWQAIDHCHETGAVRGALCFNCNTGLGQFRDSPELLAMAAAYLVRGADYRDVDREGVQ
ncbi:endonuclease VII domain-containing protein [Streptomyces sp. NPDC001205]